MLCCLVIVVIFIELGGAKRREFKVIIWRKGGQATKRGKLGKIKV